MSDERWTPPREPRDVDDALWLFQADLPTLKKDKDGQVGNQKTKYADLSQANEVVLTRLNTLDCIWVCEPRMMALGDQLRFVLGWELKHVPSGTKRAGDFPVLGDSPMKHGAAITYARRYSLLAVTGVIPEDEDDDARSFEDGHTVARRAASGHARAGQRRPARGEQVDPPQRSGRAAPPLPGDPEDPGPDAEATAHGSPAAAGLGPVRPDQHRQMHALWNELAKLGQTQYAGEENRGRRLEATAKMTGRQALNSSADLTEADADMVIHKLKVRRDTLKAAAAQGQGG